MTDDILRRLRNPELPCICTDIVLLSCHPCNARLDAADEIERLRKAGDALAHGIRTGKWDDALDAWTELRGG